MIPGFEKIVEDRIKKAQLRGEFDDLPQATRASAFRVDRPTTDDRAGRQRNPATRTGGAPHAVAFGRSRTRGQSLRDQ